MTPPVIIGIDPGLTGAIACLHADTGALIWVEDMPITNGRADVGGIVDLLDPELAHMVCVERPFRPRRQASAEAQWWNYHACIAAALVAGPNLGGVAYTPVDGKVWTAADPSLKVAKAKGMTPEQHKAAKKARRRQRACELYPADAWRFARAMDDGRADAVLIARWWIDTHGGVR